MKRRHKNSVLIGLCISFFIVIVGCGGGGDGGSSTVSSSRFTSWDGTKQIGTASDEAVTCSAADSEGNIYVAGWTTGDLDGHSNAGGRDIFVIKYDSAGNKIWSRALGSTLDDTCTGIAFDDNHFYLTGWTSGDLDGNISLGSRDFFLVKYDAAGVKHWTKQFGSANLDEGSDIIVDGERNVCITGHTEGDLDGNLNAGGKDIFISKYDPLGNWIQTVQIGSTDEDYGQDIARDADNNVYVVGRTQGDFDGYVNAGTWDLVLVKYDSLGVKQWSIQKGTLGDDFGDGITIAPNNLIYITGWTAGDLDGETNFGSEDVYLMNYDLDGNWGWTALLGTASEDVGIAITSDGSSNIYISGSTVGDLGGNINAGDRDVFLSKYDSTGNPIWTELLGSADYDRASAVVQVSDTEIYVSGATRGGLDGNTNLGGADIFLAKYSENGDLR